MVTFSKKLSAALLFGAMTFTTLASSLGVSAADDAVVEVEEQVEENNENNENNEDGAVLNTEENGENGEDGTVLSTEGYDGESGEEKGSGVLGNIAKIGVGVAVGAGGAKVAEFGLKKASVLRDENKELEDTKAELENTKAKLENVEAGRVTVKSAPSGAERFVDGMTFTIYGRKSGKNYDGRLGVWQTYVGIFTTIVAAILISGMIVLSVKHCKLKGMADWLKQTVNAADAGSIVAMPGYKDLTAEQLETAPNIKGVGVNTIVTMDNFKNAIVSKLNDEGFLDSVGLQKKVQA